MWVFNNLPLAQLKARYGFEPPPGWADHLPIVGGPVQQRRLGVVRLGRRPDHDEPSRRRGYPGQAEHAGEELSPRRLLRRGHDEDEVKAPDLELNVLVAIEDVTERVNREVTPGMDDAEAGEVRRQAMARIEKEATDKNGLRNDVVTLYQGGQYHLYTYKKYTDVRLVFAPEFDIAFFGGDPGQLRVSPIRPRHLLLPGLRGRQAGEGRAFPRVEPRRVEGGRAGLRRRPSRVGPTGSTRSPAWSISATSASRSCSTILKKQGGLPARRSAAPAPRPTGSRKEELFSVQNSRKARVGGLEGLRDDAFMTRKAEAEAELRARIKATRPSRATARRGLGPDRRGPEDGRAGSSSPGRYLERGWAFDSSLFKIARDLVRLAEESTKPNSERLKEYRESGLKSLELELFSAGADLSRVRGGQARPFARRVEEGACPTIPWSNACSTAARPAEAARQLVTGTKLADVEVRAQAGRRRHGGDRGVRRPDDQARPGRRRRGPGAPQDPARTRSKASRPPITPSSPGPSSRRRATPSIPTPPSRSGWPSASSRATRSTARRSRRSRRSAGAFEHAKAHGNTPPYELPAELDQGPRRRGSASRPRSTSSRRPTSSAATRAARSSIATTRSSA